MSIFTEFMMIERAALARQAERLAVPKAPADARKKPEPKGNETMRDPQTYYLFGGKREYIYGIRSYDHPLIGIAILALLAFAIVALIATLAE